MKRVILILVLIIIASCRNRLTTENAVFKGHSKINDTDVKNQHEVTFVDTLYVTSVHGLVMRNKTGTDADILGVLPYGKAVYVVNKEGEDFSVYENGKEIKGKFITIYEYVSDEDGAMYQNVYVFNGFLGEIEDIRLNDSLLYETYYYNFDGNTFEEQNIDSSILSIKIIPLDSKFQKEGKLSKLADPTNLKKVDGKLVIPLSGKKMYVTLKDNISDDDNYVEHKYYGFSTVINRHIVYRGYYEGGKFFFINPDIGEEEINFVGYPFISPNKKDIVAFNADPYENSGELEIYQIDDTNKIKRLLAASFKNWMPIEQDNIYWINNRTMIIKAIHAKVFWDATGNINKNNYQLIKISWD